MIKKAFYFPEELAERMDYLVSLKRGGSTLADFVRRACEEHVDKEEQKMRERGIPPKAS